MMIGENGVPETPDWTPEPRTCPPLDDESRKRLLATDPARLYTRRIYWTDEEFLASLTRGLDEAAAGLAVRRDDLLDDPENIIRGTE